MFNLNRKVIGALPAMGLALFLSVGAGFAQAPSYPQAVADYNGGRYARALSQFQALKVLYPTNALVHYYSALCEQAVGHIPQARAEFSWVIANGPASLKGMATSGLNQLSNARTSSSSSSSSSASPMVASNTSAGGSGSSGSTAPKAKVKKILEFYADW